MRTAAHVKLTESTDLANRRTDTANITHRNTHMRHNPGDQIPNPQGHRKSPRPPSLSPSLPIRRLLSGTPAAPIIMPPFIGGDHHAVDSKYIRLGETHLTARLPRGTAVPYPLLPLTFMSTVSIAASPPPAPAPPSSSRPPATAADPDAGVAGLTWLAPWRPRCSSTISSRITLTSCSSRGDGRMAWRGTKLK